MSSFYKLNNGEWGIKGPVLIKGEEVLVVKKDGSKTKVIVKDVIKKFADGVCIASIERPERKWDEES